MFTIIFLITHMDSDRGFALQLRVTAIAKLFRQQLQTSQPNIRALSVDRLPSVHYAIAASKSGVIPNVVLEIHSTSQKFESDRNLCL
jgi:hypothetical protein